MTGIPLQFLMSRGAPRRMKKIVIDSLRPWSFGGEPHLEVSKSPRNLQAVPIFPDAVELFVCY
jgi:hypothetical protein